MHRNVDLFRKEAGVRRQISEAENQASNGKTERMHRKVMNLVRSMIFGYPLALYFREDAAEYVTHILNSSPTGAKQKEFHLCEVWLGRI